MTHPLADYADDRFPLVHGWNADRGVMISFPHRGNGLRVKCIACDRQVWVGGRDIVTRFTGWLPKTVGDWAAALRCQACGSRRITVGAERDPGSDGFQLSTQDDGRVIWCRRLNTWLAEAGTDLWAYLDVLRDMPAPGELEKAGIRPLDPSDGA